MSGNGYESHSHFYSGDTAYHITDTEATYIHYPTNERKVVELKHGDANNLITTLLMNGYWLR